MWKSEGSEEIKKQKNKTKKPTSADSVKVVELRNGHKVVGGHRVRRVVRQEAVARLKRQAVRGGVVAVGDAGVKALAAGVVDA